MAFCRGSPCPCGNIELQVCSRTVRFFRSRRPTTCRPREVGLNSAFTVDHDTIVIVQGVFGAEADGGSFVIVAVTIYGVDDPDPLTWHNGHGPSSFLRSVTVKDGRLNLRIEPT